MDPANPPSYCFAVYALNLMKIWINVKWKYGKFLLISQEDVGVMIFSFTHCIPLKIVDNNLFRCRNFGVAPPIFGDQQTVIFFTDFYRVSHKEMHKKQLLDTYEP